jgi:hypothetical protein
MRHHLGRSLYHLTRAYNLLDHGAEPLGMFRGNNGQRYTIWGHHVAKFLKDACLRAQLDPHHYIRLHIDQLMAHCLRVTATVLFSNAGVTVDDISFHLRWNSDAVLHYIRDNDGLVDEITARVVAGAFLTELRRLLYQCENE